MIARWWRVPEYGDACGTQHRDRALVAHGREMVEIRGDREVVERDAERWWEDAGETERGWRDAREALGRRWGDAGRTLGRRSIVNGGTIGF